MDLKMEKQPLLEKEKLSLLAWDISGKNYIQKELRKTLQTLSQALEVKVQSFITNQLGESRIAGVIVITSEFST